MEPAMTDRMFDDPDRLLEQTRALRLLAQRLVADPHGAEDLVQSTWLVAFGAGTPSRRPIRWLRGILRNLQRQEHRSAKRRRQREEAVARSEAVDADPGVEQLETLQAVVEAVRGLPHGYRETVIARYFRNEKPRETARRWNVPAATIHTRLHRAIGLLREALDRRHGGDRQSWRAALISLTADTLVPPAILGAKLQFAVLAVATVGLVWSISAILPETESGPPRPPTGARVVADLRVEEPRTTEPAGDRGPRPASVVPSTGRRRPGGAPPGQPRPRVSGAPGAPRASSGAELGFLAGIGRLDDLALLNQLARKWFGVWLEREAPGADAATRRRLQPAFRQAKDDFYRAWERVEPRRNLLASHADLRTVFRNVFPHDRVDTPRGIVEVSAPEPPADDPRALVTYDLWLPRSYDPSGSHRAIVLVPGTDPGGGYRIPAGAYFAATWEETRIADESIFVMPRVSVNPALDALVSDDFEQQQMGSSSVLGPMGSVQNTYHLDRERIILDCGKGASAFGVWMVSNFPNLFAGLILRWPVDVSALRVGSLTGMPVLVITNPETRLAGRELARRLNALSAGSCTWVNGRGRYPYPDSSRGVATWVADIHRRRNPERIVIEPNNDFFNDSFWVRINEAEPLEPLSLEERPVLIVEADREENRIRISARGIVEVQLLLNHELVDLDRPFTVVVNGTSVQKTVQPSLDFLTDKLFHSFDSTWIYTGEVTLDVPK